MTASIKKAPAICGAILLVMSLLVVACTADEPAPAPADPTAAPAAVTVPTAAPDTPEGARSARPAPATRSASCATVDPVAG